ncbi:hypothetical protein AVEN_93637-1 [Araneus ventricosus]|uniref:Uncharacterized protein n=2 Tax=Araneus ventricosus TaxID=182803 RepID=A0A4Y2UK85_ARAVE|nr:hypothetical protein AVEN_188488-1 [Araneus ventricosus]GBO13063.1 hypothetical protein AVEN_93637-1 [Araneus ventricosus]
MKQAIQMKFDMCSLHQDSRFLSNVGRTPSLENQLLYPSRFMWILYLKTTTSSQPFSMKWPSGVPWCMATTWSTTYVVEKCDVIWKLPHPVLTGGSERLLQKSTFGIDLSNYNVG